MEQAYNLIDLKPQILGIGLSFVINTAKFSPYHESLMAYSASNGDVALYDLDMSMKNAPVMLLSNKTVSGIKSVSDLAYVDSNMIVTRSLNIVSLFDRMHAYTGSCFNSVYCVNLLTSETEKVYVGDTREYDISNRIRCIVQVGSGFASGFNKRLYRYDRK